ncbi:glucose-methanol-choline oxidoreductase [Mycobacterium sp. CBMA 234]|uniref:GMC family oxidoreductase n=1 Tax=Mycolicibacterium sp. CBMA 234 TaxID=1918495 RepID=UPI0012DD45AF|nr:GMC family oxidoreductase N-terminal domain-containing protein [Mycolicibacterium sp. CBMA 234]MUL64599.1 glucose-methanol-choline oxidoreductase [Mycolicibacterium sp. CBMA 234]
MTTTRPETSYETADFVVVGAGSAGAALAGRLATRGASVLLLEAGPEDKKAAIHIPAAFPQLFRTELDWDYHTEPQAGLAGRSVHWPRGKMLGGSSSMNAMCWVPGFAADYDEWAEQAGPDWSWKSVNGYLNRITDPAAPIGLRTTSLRSPNPHTAEFLMAARELGYDVTPANPATPTGFSPMTVNQDRGRRFSTADGYLKPLRNNPRLRVRTGAHTTSVDFDGLRAVGVTYVVHGVTRHMRATREVILSAGAINTPHLLMLSGIGDPDHLAKYGVPVRVNAPEVGQRMFDHMVTGLAVQSSGPTLYTAGRPRHVADFLTRRRGPLTSNVVEAFGFVRSRPELELPDLEIAFLPVPFIDEGRNQPDQHGFTVGTVLLRPESTGSVQLASADPFTKPAVDPGYLSDPEGADRAALTAGVETCRKFVQRLTARGRTNGRYIRPLDGHELAAEELCAAAIDQVAQTIYHPVGTARMGSDPASVVDPQLRVRGVAGLRVADASVMPNLVRGHTHAAAVVIGERCADLLLDS